MTERRFTDREVALILRRASELDEGSSPATAPRGLSESELKEIAGEVGIDPAMITRAVSELQGRRGLERASLLGPATVNQQIRAVPRELSRDELGDLVRVVDQRVPAQGTVAEALGAVRWNAPGRFLSRLVSMEPSRGETVIRVEERYSQRFRAALHGVPTAYGAMIGWVIGLETVGGALAGVLLGGLLGAAGWAVAGVVWHEISRRSQRRVDALADELTAGAEGGGAAE
jgi:RNase P/RNase MRP subunit POP5